MIHNTPNTARTVAAAAFATLSALHLGLWIDESIREKDYDLADKDPISIIRLPSARLQDSQLLEYAMSRLTSVQAQTLISECLLADHRTNRIYFVDQYQMCKFGRITQEDIVEYILSQRPSQRVNCASIYEMQAAIASIWEPEPLRDVPYKICIELCSK